MNIQKAGVAMKAALSIVGNAASRRAARAAER